MRARTIHSTGLLSPRGHGPVRRRARGDRSGDRGIRHGPIVLHSHPFAESGLLAEPEFAPLTLLNADFDKEKALVEALGVSNRSTFVAFKGATEVGRSVADMNKESIAALLRRALHWRGDARHGPQQSIRSSVDGSSSGGQSIGAKALTRPLPALNRGSRPVRWPRGEPCGHCRVKHDRLRFRSVGRPLSRGTLPSRRLEVATRVSSSGSRA